MTSTVSLEERKNDLRNTVRDLVKGSARMEEVIEDRDLLAAALGMTEEVKFEGNLLSPFPYTNLEQWALVPLPQDEMGRVVIQPTENIELADRWKVTIDRLTGIPVQVRKADCGAGCKCAAEVRIISDGF